MSRNIRKALSPVKQGSGKFQYPAFLRLGHLLKMGNRNGDRGIVSVTKNIRSATGSRRRPNYQPMGFTPSWYLSRMGSWGSDRSRIAAR